MPDEHVGEEPNMPMVESGKKACDLDKCMEFRV